jgi:hypothetical protein
VIKENLQNCFDSNGTTALMMAADCGHQEVVDLLLANNCRLNMSNHDGDTAYIFSCFGGYCPIAKSLIEAGCDYSISNKTGKSGMDYLKERHPDKVDEVQVITHPNSATIPSII